METKTCTKCKEVFPLTREFFHVRKEVKSGFGSHCKLCKSKRKKDKPSKIGNKVCTKCKSEFPKTNEFFHNHNGILYCHCKECVKKRDKEYYEITREKQCAYSKEWRKNNRDRHLENCRRWYYENIDEVKMNYKTWRSNNLDMRRKHYHKREALKKQLDNNFTVTQWNDCLEHFKHECAYCGSNEELTQEHFIPLSKGGEYTVNNIIPACSHCNSSKGNRDFKVWYPKQDSYTKARVNKIHKYLNYKQNMQQLALFK